MLVSLMLGLFPIETASPFLPAFAMQKQPSIRFNLKPITLRGRSARMLSMVRSIKCTLIGADQIARRGACRYCHRGYREVKYCCRR